MSVRTTKTAEEMVVSQVENMFIGFSHVVEGPADEIEIQEAIEIMQHIQQQAEEILGRDHRRTSDARAALGLLQAHAKEFVPAIENLEAAVQAMKESLGEKHHLTIQRAKQLAIVSSIDASHKKARNQRAF